MAWRWEHLNFWLNYSFTDLLIFFYWVQMTNLVIPLNYAHHTGSHLDHQHHVTLQEGTTMPTLSPPAEKSKSPTTHPHHILQGHHWECADQLHHCLVRELQCCWPQDPPADSEHSCKDHRCPSPIHPGHFPCTMLQQNQQHREDPHPPLPQSLPAPTIRKTVPEHQSPLRQTAQQLFPPGCESPEPKSPRPPLKPHANPYLLKHGPSRPPPPLQTPPPNLTTPKKKLYETFFLCNSNRTGEWACTNHL